MTIQKFVQIDLTQRGRKTRVIRRCSCYGCVGRAYKNNLYCQKCTRRYQRHGDPTVILKRGRKVG